MITAVLQKIQVSRELKYFAATTFMMGMASSFIDSTLNNYLDQEFKLTGFQRSFLELPREIPGFLVVFISAALWFLCSRRLGTIALLMSMLGTFLIGFISSTYTVMVACLFIYSIGQHLFIPVSSGIGMELAREGKIGQRLGQMNAIRNLSAILGSFIVFIAFSYCGLSFHHIFFTAAAVFLLGALCMNSMQPQHSESAPKIYLKLHKEYRLYYLLAVFYGGRKQIFLTFAPWVLVTVFKQPTQTIATLLTIGGAIGILFQPLLGKAVDRLGERWILAAESLLLIVVCLGYGFSRFLFPGKIAFLVACVCFLLDQMLMSVNMARSMYMKKIAICKEHIQPALSTSVTIDHIFSIAVALVCGVVWNRFGYQYVFLAAAFIALLNLLAVKQIKIPVGKPAR